MLVRLFLLFMALIPTSIFAQEEGPTDIEDNLSWVVYCTGDLQKAKIVQFLSAGAATPPFCVKMEESLFSPLLSSFTPLKGVPPPPPWERSNKIWLLIDSGPGAPSQDPWTVTVTSEKQLPECNRCEEACQKPKKTVSGQFTSQIKFNRKGVNRALVDVTRDVKDWHLAGIKIKATVEGPLSTFRASKDVRGWKWCRSLSESSPQ